MSPRIPASQISKVEVCLTVFFYILTNSFIEDSLSIFNPLGDTNTIEIFRFFGEPSFAQMLDYNVFIHW